MRPRRGQESLDDFSYMTILPRLLQELDELIGSARDGARRIEGREGADLTRASLRRCLLVAE